LIIYLFVVQGKKKVFLIFGILVLLLELSEEVEEEEEEV
jgi:hypothetical protein